MIVAFITFFLFFCVLSSLPYFYISSSILNDKTNKNKKNKKSKTRHISEAILLSITFLFRLFLLCALVTRKKKKNFLKQTSLFFVLPALWTTFLFLSFLRSLSCFYLLFFVFCFRLLLFLCDIF